MRSFWKGPFIDSTILKPLTSLQPAALPLAGKTLRSRRSTILPFFEKVGCKVYNGNKYVWLTPTLSHIGHKFGDFVLTKKKCRPKIKPSKAKKK